jgi:hypothetical protein
MRCKKISIFAIFCLLLGLFYVPQAHAVSLLNISDVITTSRPSTLIPLEVVTAKHTIKFTTVTTTPVNGKIVITFSGTGDNTASPSATAFAFNNLQVSNITAGFSSGTSTCLFAVSAPTIVCNVGTAQINPGTTVTIVLGAASPTLINPTKSAATETADIWRINIKTQDAASLNLDSGYTKIATIESVAVQVAVNPSLTLKIAPVAGPINIGNAVGCANTETTNNKIASTATTVNLGILNTIAINISAQLITVTTNAKNGYALTAASSGHLINPANAVWIADSTTPKAMTAGTAWFGIHPCGLNVDTAVWGTGKSGGGVNAKYGWPSSTTPLTLSSATIGPIGNTTQTGGVGAGLTSVEYAATIDPNTAAGIYTSVITYTATPTF